MDVPAWYDGKAINETLFCEEFLAEHPMVRELGVYRESIPAESEGKIREDFDRVR